MQIKIEHFSARRTLLFYLPTGFYVDGAEICDIDNLSESILLQNLANINGTKRCLITPELLAITYTETANSDDIQALVLAELDDYEGNPIAINNTKQLSPNKQTIEALTDAFIRPTLFRDKGDIEIIDLQNNVLTLRFTGHCAGCPYAQNTLNNVIVRTFRKYIPQIKEVKTEE